MAEKDDMGAVTHQLSTVDDDVQHKTVKETNVASVALGKPLPILHLDQHNANAA